jgi:predicted ATPase/class 3 adenylate cyclase
MNTPGLPSGTVTFLFTDVEGSTRLLERLGEAYADALLEHRRVVRDAFAAEGGVEVDTQGDAFFVAFPSAGGAAAAALAAQAALAAWPVRVRMGLHTGEPQLTREGYVGMDVHRGARIAAAGHGGQILVSEPTQKLLGERDDLRDLGRHRLKDMGAAERIFQLGEGDFARLRSLNQTNLPIQATPFLGREEVLGDLVELMRRGDVRLVTLIGPGGTGKTRLSLQAAAELVEDHPDGGVWFASLAAVTDIGLLAPAIGQALGLRDAGDEPLEAIARHIRARSTLLVIDNLEQLLPDAARPLASLLAECPGLKLLVTSREPLRVAAEHEFPVAPFKRDEAVAFFAERAQAVRPGFAVGGENRGTVDAVCARLDDLPLALELAAARVKLLSPDALLARLEQRLPLLVGGARDAPERQRTLRGAIAWSHDLLPPEERQMFARLAVFAGGWTLDAAEEVCEASVDGLEALIDKSLVVFAPSSAGQSRYTMLETIREFAAEQLALGGESAVLRPVHARFYCALAEEAESGLKGREQKTWLERLEADHENLRASLEWSLTQDPATALRLAAAAWLFWYTHGHVTEGRAWLGRVLAVADSAPSGARAKALDGAGYLASEQNDHAVAAAALEESLDCARRIGSDEDAAIVLAHMCSVMPGDPNDGWPRGHEAVALARATGNNYILGVALNNLGDLASKTGKPHKAFFEESYRVRLETGDASRIALSLINLAECALGEGDAAEARRLAGDALERAQQIGDRRNLCLALEVLGVIALADGAIEEAAGRLGECLALARELGHLLAVLDGLNGLAEVASRSGDATRAARLAGAADALRRSIRASHHDHAPDESCSLAAARGQLGSEAWAAAWSAGASISLDDAIDFALAKPRACGTL